MSTQVCTGKKSQKIEYVKEEKEKLFQRYFGGQNKKEIIRE